MELKDVRRGLRLLVLERPPGGRPFTARQKYYTLKAIVRDYPDQYKQSRENNQGETL